MKRFLIALMLCCVSLSAGEWQTHWTSGLENCISKNYVEAEKDFNVAISIIEREGITKHPHIYVDRARLFSLLNRNEEALNDLNIALLSPLLQGDDKLRAVVTRLVTYYRLGMTEESKSELEIFKSIYPIPKLEVYKKSVVIRNLPDCSCSQELLKSFVANTFCESPDDVKITNNICIAKRKACGCGYNKLQGPPLTNFKALRDTSVSDCTWWCDKMQVSGNLFCVGTFTFFRCQAACIATVEILKDGCYWCCNQGNVYQHCVKPFEDILGRMGQGCDPAWD